MEWSAIITSAVIDSGGMFDLTYGVPVTRNYYCDRLGSVDLMTDPHTMCFSLESPEQAALRDPQLTALWESALAPKPLRTVILASWPWVNLAGPILHHVGAEIMRRNRGSIARLYNFQTQNARIPNAVDWPKLLEEERRKRPR